MLLEVGYFIGRLDCDRVCAVKQDEVEIPSDFRGVVYETFDLNGGWRVRVGQEFQATGYEVDRNKVMGA